MNEREVGELLGRSVDQRVRRLRPRTDFEALLSRLEQRHTHRRRQWIGAVVVALCAGIGLGALLTGVGGGHSSRTLLVPADGVPGPQAPTATFQPADVATARAAITDAFRAGFDGNTPPDERVAAKQDGPALEPLVRASIKQAQRFGYTPAQLAGTTIDVSDVSFIDESHAIVKFTLLIPGHGAVLTDRIGYAILDHGRWKVALRTSCDLLSLTGLGQECPPAS